jgi:hypothetical protein
MLYTCCFFYSPETPPISNRVIWNLGQQFCKIAPREFTDEKLAARRTFKTSVKKLAIKKQAGNGKHPPNDQKDPNGAKKK